MSRRQSQTKGFVLVNALIIVTALAAAATLLLTRAGTGQAQLAAHQQAAQLEAYLDAFEVLALSLIDRDPGPADHPGEAWARAQYSVPLDRGQVAGGLRDLQAGFNVNLLAGATDPGALMAFGRIIGELGVSSQAGEAIVKALSAGGPDRPVAVDGVETDLPGGPLSLIEQLPIPDRDRARLAPYLVALPGNVRVNVNTAPPLVLRAVLPGASSSDIEGLLQRRARQPFGSDKILLDHLAQVLAPEEFDALAATPRLSVGSDWFAADITAELDGRLARRRVVIQRQSLPAGAEVAYRLDRW